LSIAEAHNMKDFGSYWLISILYNMSK